MDLSNLCSVARPWVQVPVVAKRVNPPFANSLGNRSAKPARGFAIDEEITHGGLHLGHTGARSANVVWIPTKKLWLDVTASAITFTKVDRLGGRRHL